ncbi:MAG TPA: hypothetical protein VMQ67_05500, partial [Candidatus Saccharimonadales bacterium]|nr:hypothetical protein [Candidatus Saccharimonadales bacterium]
GRIRVDGLRPGLRAVAEKPAKNVAERRLYGDFEIAELRSDVVLWRHWGRIGRWGLGLGLGGLRLRLGTEISSPNPNLNPNPNPQC